MIKKASQDLPREGDCPRCGAHRLRAWSELSEPERDIARRMSSTATVSTDARAERSLWCTRCWYEQRDTSPQYA